MLKAFGRVEKMFWHLFKTETFIQMHPILLLWIIIKPVTCIPQFHSIRMLQAIVVMRKCSEFNPLCLPSYDMTHKNGGILRFVHYSGKSFYVLVCKIHQPNLSHFEKKKKAWRSLQVLLISKTVLKHSQPSKNLLSIIKILLCSLV